MANVADVADSLRLVNCCRRSTLRRFEERLLYSSGGVSGGYKRSMCRLWLMYSTHAFQHICSRDFYSGTVIVLGNEPI